MNSHSPDRRKQNARLGRSNPHCAGGRGVGSNLGDSIQPHKGNDNHVSL